MGITEKPLEVSCPSTEFESQALLITVPNEYKEIVSPRRSFSDLSQNTIPITATEISLHGSDTSVNDGTETQEAFGNVPSTAKKNSRNR